MTQFSLEPLDLAALLCSRVCHDVISPVGAIVNGLEMMEDEKDADMRSFALDLIKKSAHTASAKLQFCRLAFGGAASVGATIDTGDAEKVARGLIEDEKVKLTWNSPRVLMSRSKVKLVLNLCLIAAAAVPRGGTIVVTMTGEGDAIAIRVESRSAIIRVASHVRDLLMGQPENGTIDAHGIQPYYTGLVAQSANMVLNMVIEPEMVVLEANPVMAAQIAEVAAEAA